MLGRLSTVTSQCIYRNPPSFHRWGTRQEQTDKVTSGVLQDQFPSDEHIRAEGAITQKTHNEEEMGDS